MTISAPIAWRGPPPAQPYGAAGELAAQIRRSERASAAGLRVAEAARLTEAAWRAKARESWLDGAETLENARGHVQLVTEDADGGVKSFSRPADTLPALVRMLKPDLRLLDVRWSAA